MRRVGRFVSGVFALAFLALGGVPVHSQAAGPSAERAAHFVQDVGNRITGLLATPDAPDDAVRQQIEAIIRESVDLEALGRSSLGAHWQRATETQRQDYQESFAAWAASAYAERLGANRGGRLTVLGALPGASGAYVRVRIARANGQTSNLDLRVQESASRMRIVGAEVDGISMDVTLRDEFSSVVRRQGLDALIASLRTQVAALRPSSN